MKKYCRRFIAILFLSALIHATVSAQDAKSRPPMPLNLAHRGVSFLLPENTIAAFKLAIQVGADAAECDVYRTADGVLVLSHDRNAKRTAGVDVDITTIPFEEVRKFDVGKWRDSRFAGEKMPTLEEYLQLLKGTSCTPVVEIKQEGTEKEIVDLIRRIEMLDKVFIVSFSSRSLAEVRSLEPRLNFAHIFSWKVEGTPESQAETFAEKITNQAGKVGTNVVSLQHGMLSRKLVDLLHEKGFHVWAWTVNDVPRMNMLLDWGLDSITSDRADVLAAVIEGRKKNGSLQSPPAAVYRSRYGL